MNAELPGFDLTAGPYTDDDGYRDEAARAIHRVKESFQSDLDKLVRVVNAGGNLPEMRAAVDAAWLLKEILHGLELAVDRVLGHDAPADVDGRDQT